MENEPESVRELFDAEYAGLVRLATLITGDVAGAEDAVQEAFARAVARWPRLRSYDRPGAWVRRVTIRLAVRDRGRRRRELPLPWRQNEWIRAIARWIRRSWPRQQCGTLVRPNRAPAPDRFPGWHR